MKKKIRTTAITLAIGLALFVFGPFIGQSMYRWITPAATITALETDAHAANESLRLDALRKLAQRGIHPDEGIRDEAIEHNVTPYTLFVMVCWRWQDLLGI